MGTEMRRCSHVAALSPVQMAPYRCVPAKKERLSTKGRSPSEPNAALPLAIIPSAVALHGRAMRAKTYDGMLFMLLRVQFLANALGRSCCCALSLEHASSVDGCAAAWYVRGMLIRSRK